MDKKIYLIRHGHINTGNEKRYIGITDIPLDDIGKVQAQEIRDFFKSIEFEKIFSSPLKRCVETSEIIGEGRNVEICRLKNFMEINMGDWDNKSIDYIKSKYPKEYEARGKTIDSYVPPNGESFNMLAERVMSGFNDVICDCSDNTIIVAHAGVNRIIISKLTGVPIQDIFTIKQHYACISQLYYSNTEHKWKYKLLL